LLVQKDTDEIPIAEWRRLPTLHVTSIKVKSLQARWIRP